VQAQGHAADTERTAGRLSTAGGPAPSGPLARRA
jgi:hypothetical protein